MTSVRSLRALLACLCLATPLGVRAAPGDWVSQIKPMPAPADGHGLGLDIAPSAARAAGAAGSEAWASDGRQRMIYNVSRPQLIAVGGEPAGGCGNACPAVILVPGGGFQFLSIDNEGYLVAERLRPLGVKVFILKYRTLPVTGGFAGFQAAIGSVFASKPGSAPVDIEADVPYAVADAQMALRTVRAHAAEWRVDPTRVGLLGFSAGAMTTLSLTQANAQDARPDFIGLIYGPTKAAPVPPKAPALFDAIAADDHFFAKDDLGLIEAWRASGASVEFHLYSAGGHGFASQPNGTTSDAWLDEFARWLRATKIVAAR